MSKGISQRPDRSRLGLPRISVKQPYKLSCLELDLHIILFRVFAKCGCISPSHSPIALCFSKSDTECIKFIVSYISFIRTLNLSDASCSFRRLSRLFMAETSQVRQLLCHTFQTSCQLDSLGIVRAFVCYCFHQGRRILHERYC